jgi:hypothetical protein
VKPTLPIIRKLKRKKTARPAWSESQTAQYKELIGQLEAFGFVTRREELKRGHCWKVLSGACRSLSQKMVFVDSRLTPDEQISFLSAKLTEAQAESQPMGAVVAAG